MARGFALPFLLSRHHGVGARRRGMAGKDDILPHEIPRTSDPEIGIRRMEIGTYRRRPVGFRFERLATRRRPMNGQ